MVVIDPLFFIIVFTAHDPVCNSGDIRLVGGVAPNQGRVEICHNGVWGTVYGEEEGELGSQEEAAVVCHQLGYNLSETSMFQLLNELKQTSNNYNGLIE